MNSDCCRNHKNAGHLLQCFMPQTQACSCTWKGRLCFHNCPCRRPRRSPSSAAGVKGEKIPFGCFTLKWLYCSCKSVLILLVIKSHSPSLLDGVSPPSRMEGFWSADALPSCCGCGCCHSHCGALAATVLGSAKAGSVCAHAAATAVPRGDLHNFIGLVGFTNLWYSSLK